MEQIIIYCIISIVSVLFGHAAASISNNISREDEFKKGLRIGRTNGYADGYTDGYNDAQNIISGDDNDEDC